MNNNTIFPNAVTDRCPHLRSLYGCFGYEQTLLMPARPDGSPDLRHPDKYTLAASHSTETQRDLSRQPVTVVLGPRSDHLCCVVCHADSLEEFLTDNPVLRDTTQQSIKNVVRLFVRVACPYPSSMSSQKLAWISSDHLVIHSPERNAGYEFLNQNRPCSISFDQIVWPADLAWYFTLWRLENKTPPKIATPKGSRLNDDYLIALFRLHHDLGFDPASKRFYIQGEAEHLWPETVQQKLRDLLQALQSRFSDLVIDMSAQNLKKITKLLEICCAAPLPDSADSINRYVADHLERCPGSDVTVSELYAGYRSFLGEFMIAGFSEGEFQKRIEASIKSQFGIGKSNDLRRDGGCKRGFHNIRQRTERTPRTGEIPSDSQNSTNVIRLVTTT